MAGRKHLPPQDALELLEDIMTRGGATLTRTNHSIDEPHFPHRLHHSPPSSSDTLRVLPVDFLEYRLAAQHRETQPLLVENQQLAVSDVALKQHLTASQKEVRQLSPAAADIKAEREAELCEIHYKPLKMEAEVREIKRGRMTPKKQSAANNGKENLTWTRNMDDALIEAFMQEYNDGHKVNGTFTTTAYDNIVQELSAMFGKKINKEKVKNRWKTLKKNFSEVYDIFKNGVSGFAWNPSTQLWDADSKVWDALIESKPKAANWRNTPLPYYEKMVILYGNDKATGEDAEAATEMRKRPHSTTEQDFIETIDDLNNLAPRNEVTLDNIDAFVDVANDNLSNVSAQEPSPGATSGSNKKRKVAAIKEKNSEFNKVIRAIYEVADALREGNAIMREYSNYKLPQISGEETWNLIKECGCDIDLLPKIYCFLMTDIKKLRAVLQCPTEARKAVIMQLVFDSSNMPSH